jgi:hypothetical protein
MEINDNNYVNLLYEFAINKFNEAYKKYGKKFITDIIDKIDDLSLIPENATEQQKNLILITGFIYFFRDPKTGKTLVDEFFEKFKVDKKINDKINGLRNIMRIESILEEIRKIDDRYIGKFYDPNNNGIVYVDLTAKGLYDVLGEYIDYAIIHGFIYKWDDYFRFLGPAIIEELDDISWEEMEDFILRDYSEAYLSKIEGRLINERITLKSFIKGYTFHMIDGMYFALGFKDKILKKDKIEKIVKEVTVNTGKILKKLPTEALEELKFIYDNGGIVRYSKIKSRYGDDRDIFWNDNPPQTPTGILKLFGLIVVGTMVKSGRRYRMAVIPADVRDSLKKFL